MILRSVCLGAILMLCALSTRAEDRLTILHTNDFHARFEPVNRFDAPCGKKARDVKECFGGPARLITAIRAARSRAGDAVLLLDGGDQFQGTLFYNHYKGQLAAEMMNWLGYDAMTVGNHEFAEDARVIRAAGAQSTMDATVAADAHDTGPFLAGLVAGYPAVREPFSPCTGGRRRARAALSGRGSLFAS